MWLIVGRLRLQQGSSFSAGGPVGTYGSKSHQRENIAIQKIPMYSEGSSFNSRTRNETTGSVNFRILAKMHDVPTTKYSQLFYGISTESASWCFWDPGTSHSSVTVLTRRRKRN